MTLTANGNVLKNFKKTQRRSYKAKRAVVSKQRNKLCCDRQQTTKQIELPISVKEIFEV